MGRYYYMIGKLFSKYQVSVYPYNLMYTSHTRVKYMIQSKQKAIYSAQLRVKTDRSNLDFTPNKSIVIYLDLDKS